MARSEVRIPVDIWEDERFTTQPVGPQRLLLTLISQRDMTEAGTLDLRPRRWAKLSSGMTTATVVDELAQLEAGSLIATDHDTDELLAIDFMRWQGGYLNPKRRPGIERAIADIYSPTLRAIAAATLAELAATIQQRTPEPPKTPHRPKATSPRPYTSPPPRRRSQKVTPALRLAVYRKTGFQCARCAWMPEVPDGYDGRYALAAHEPGRTPDRPLVRILEIDHIHPYTLGGRLSLDNCQALCSQCNNQKGAKV